MTQKWQTSLTAVVLYIQIKLNLTLIYLHKHLILYYELHDKLILTLNFLLILQGCFSKVQPLTYYCKKEQHFTKLSAKHFGT